MATIYTAYGFVLGEPTEVKPKGSNHLVYMNTGKAPSKEQQKATYDLALKMGYDTLAFYEDDKCKQSIELW